MLRALFLLLLLVNLAYFGWHWMQGPAETEDTVAVPGPPPGDAPLYPPPVVPEVALEPDPDPDPPAPALFSGWECSQAGPFEDLAQARLLASLGGIPIQLYRPSEQAVLSSWWVFLPPESDGDMEAHLQSLEEAGDSDFHRIAEGEHAGGLSFGLFTSPDRAETRRQQLAELGVDARIQPRTTDREVYWLTLAGPPDRQQLPPPDERNWILLPAICPRPMPDPPDS